MKIIITSEKSSHMMEKLHHINKMSEELLECFEEHMHEMNRRSPMTDRFEDDDDNEYRHNERRGFRGGRYRY